MKQALGMVENNLPGEHQPTLFAEEELPHVHSASGRKLSAPGLNGQEPGGKGLRYPYLNEDGQIRPIAVLKFGHSVLQSVDHVSLACNEIYRRLREGYKVVAVVSAIGNETSELLKVSEDLFFDPNSPALPKLLRIGEFRSSALVSLALSNLGVNCHPVDPHEIDLLAHGGPMDADLAGVNLPKMLDLLAKYDVLVVPGFVAHDEEGNLVALGRGGTDLTAIYLANALLAERTILLKDVDGLYDSDPNAEGASANRFLNAGWETAREVGGEVVQEKALDAARRAGRPFEIAACVSARSTLIGALPDEAVPAVRARRLKVALLGLGTVGGGVYRQLLKYPEMFEVVKVLVRDPAKHQEEVADPALLTDDPEAVAHSGAELLVEMMGGVDLAGDLVEAALRRGADVVTANKSLVAQKWSVLAEAAAASGAEIRYSAAVGGGVPMLEALDRARALGPVRKVEAVVNGTCNFVLGRLDQGDSLDDAVALAQEKGFAEADPSADVDGRDAAEKLVIIVRHAFGVELSADAISCQSLRDLSADAVQQARREGKVYKQVSSCEQDDEGLRASVSLVAVDADGYLAGAVAEQNRFQLTTASGAMVSLSGKGAGRWPTTEAVLADLLGVWRQRAEVEVEVDVELAYPAEQLVEERASA
jgi:homoserine dehydrogenase